MKAKMAESRVERRGSRAGMGAGGGESENWNAKIGNRNSGKAKMAY